MNKIIKFTFKFPDEKNGLLYNPTFETLGYYAGSSDRWQGNDTQIQKDLINAANSNSLDIIDHETFYRCSKLALPRDKMNVVCKKYNAKVIRDITIADRIIISNKYIDLLFKQTWNSIYQGKQFIKIIEDSAKIFNKEEYAYIQSMVEEDSYYNIDIPYNYYSKNIHKDTFSNLCSKYNISKGYHNYIPIDNYATFKQINLNKSKLIFDTTLAEKATEDALIIDTETYERLAQMFVGHDQENHMLGLEMMANCNFEKSQGFIALLFFRFCENVFKGSKSWNHVNIKAMRQKFEQYSLHYARHNAAPYNSFIERIAKEGGLTTFVMEAMIDNLYNNVIKSTFGITANSVFELDRSNLKLKKEYADKCVNKNIGQVLLEEHADLPF